MKSLSAKSITIGLIRIYRKGISPLFPPVCRYYPTCSQYMIDAIQRYGVFRGVGLGLRRLLRCHPFHPGGYDPVPPGLYQIGTTSLKQVLGSTPEQGESDESN